MWCYLYQVAVSQECKVDFTLKAIKVSHYSDKANENIIWCKNNVSTDARKKTFAVTQHMLIRKGC